MRFLRLEKLKAAYGGLLLKKKKARERPRPISQKNTMHLTLRSTLAKGAWSFLTKSNQHEIKNILKKFCTKYEVQILSFANVGNHLHLQIKIARIADYKKFIRAIPSAIAVAVTGCSKKKPLDKKFWDYRPFTRIVFGLASRIRLHVYIYKNQLEAAGFTWGEIDFHAELEQHRLSKSPPPFLVMMKL